MQKRAFDRAIPKSPITVVFEDPGHPVTYGAVANISEGGACVWTAARFDVGKRLTARLSFVQQPQPFDTPAVVVWGAEDPTAPESTQRYGVRWVDAPAACRQEIRRLVASSD